MTRRMMQMLSVTIALISLGEALLANWVALAWTGSGLSFGQIALSIVGFAAFNAAVFPQMRRRIRAGGLGRIASRGWIFGSISALLSGVLLAALFVVVGGGGQLLGVEVGPALVGLGGVAIALCFGAVAWGATVGNYRVRIDRLSLPLRNATGPLQALRIAHITDLHVGPLMPAPRLRGFVDRINRLDADLIVITGDIFDFDPTFVEDGCRELGKLQARHGVYAVLGNHDIYTGAATIVEGLHSLTSIRLLRDAWERIDVDGTPFVIAGLDDPGEGWTERDSKSPELVRLAREIPEDEPCLLLAHRPAFFAHAAELGFSLVLSGHTHGGQVALPFAHHHNPSRMISDRTRGKFRSGGSTLYVNRGLGMAGLSLRINCPREIALIQLVDV